MPEGFGQGQVYVPIVPSFRNFLRDVSQEAVKSSKAAAAKAKETFERGFKPEATIELDTSPADRSAKELKAKLEAMSRTKLVLDADASQANARLKALRADLAALKKTVQIDANNEDAKRKIKAIQVAMAAIRDEKVKVDVDTAGAAAQIATLKAQIAGIDDETVEIDVKIDKGKAAEFDIGAIMGAYKIPAIVTGLSIVSTGVVALGAAAAGAAAASAPLAGLYAAYPSVAIAFQQASGTIMLAMDGIGEAVDKLQDPEAKAKDVKAALAALSPAAQDLAKQLAKLTGPSGPIDGLKKGLQEAIAPGFATALRNVTGLIPTFREGLTGTARVIGGLAVEASSVMKTPFFQGQLSRIMETNNRVISNGGRAGIALGQALIDIVDAFRPVLESMSQYALAGARFVQTTTRAGLESGKLGAFFERGWELAKQFGSVIADVAVGIFNIGRESQEMGSFLGEGIAKGAEAFRAFTESTTGQNSIREYFRTSIPIVKELVGIVGDALKGMAGLAQNPAIVPVLQQIRSELLPALFELANGVSSSFGPAIISAATAFLKFQNALSFSPLAVVLQGLADTVILITNAVAKAPAPLNMLLSSVLALGLGVKAGTIALGTLSSMFAPVAAGWTAVATAQGRATLAAKLHVVQTKLAVFWTKASAAAAKAWAAAQWLLNAAMTANPIGLIVVALVALGAALVVAYQKSETFRNIVQGAWTKVKEAAELAWNGIKEVFEWLKGAFSDVGGTFSDGWKKAVDATKNAWDSLRKAVTDKWDALVKWVKTGIVAFARELISGWNDVSRNTSEAWNKIKQAVTDKWNELKKWVADGLRDLARNIVDAWNNVRKDASAKWNDIKNAVTDRWKELTKWISDTVRDLMKALVGWWNDTRKDASDKWREIKDAVTDRWKELTKWIADTVRDLMKALVGWWNDTRKDASDRWKAIKDAIVDRWKELTKWISETVRDLMRALVGWWNDTRKDASAKWNDIKNAVTDRWKELTKWISDTVRELMRNLVGWWNDVKKDASQKWQDIKKAVTDRWTEMGKDVKQKATDLIRAVKGWWGDIEKDAKTAWGSIVKAIGDKWDGIKKAIADPVKWVADKVLGPLASAWDKVAGAVDGLKSIGSVSVNIPGFAEGGWTGRGGKYEPAGIVHKDEHVWTKEESARFPGGHRGLEQLRAKAREGTLQGIANWKALGEYAGGGQVRLRDRRRNKRNDTAKGRGSNVTWPTVGRATSTYGGHDGVDINQPPGKDVGEPTWAFRRGTVDYVGYDRGYGNAVFLNTAVGTVVYGHHLANSVKVRGGQSVRQGQQLGRVGATSGSTPVSGAHLHFGFPGGTYAGAMRALDGADMSGGSTGDTGGFFLFPDWLNALLQNPLKYLNDALAKDAFKSRPPGKNFSAGLETGAKAARDTMAVELKAAVASAKAAAATAAPSGSGEPGDTTGLTPSTKALYQDVKRRFPVSWWSLLRPGAVIAGSGKPSDHGIGKAVDAGVSSGVAQGSEKALGDSIARWAIGPGKNKHPIQNVIWWDRIWSGSGWSHYGGTDYNTKHQNHVHMDIFDQGGLARGAGFMPKRTIAPERILSPRQTRSFETLVQALTANVSSSRGTYAGELGAGRGRATIEVNIDKIVAADPDKAAAILERRLRRVVVGASS